MSMTSIRQINGGEELQGDVRALLNIVGKDKEAFFNEILNWLLAEAPKDFSPEILRSSKLVKLVSSAINVNNELDTLAKAPHISFIEENGEQFTLKTSNTAANWDGTLEYSTNTQDWTTWNGSEISSSKNGKLYLRGTNNTRISYVTKSFKLTSGKRIYCVGNIENLLDHPTVTIGKHPTMANDCYMAMFQGCDSLITAPSLPASALTSQCYVSMFHGCTSLMTAPELPAMTLANYCYSQMFHGCTSLTTAPELPATTLVDGCYNQMFQGCTSLTTAPSQLPAAKLANRCYSMMFYQCTSLTNTIHCPVSISNDSNRLNANTNNLPAKTATVVYDL